MLISELCRELDKIRDKFGDIKIEVRGQLPPTKAGVFRTYFQ